MLIIIFIILLFDIGKTKKQKYYNFDKSDNKNDIESFDSIIDCNFID